jgi:hypothetical protein
MFGLLEQPESLFSDPTDPVDYFSKGPSQSTLRVEPSYDCYDNYKLRPTDVTEDRWHQP